MMQNETIEDVKEIKLQVDDLVFGIEASKVSIQTSQADPVIFDLDAAGIDAPYPRAVEIIPSPLFFSIAIPHAEFDVSLLTHFTTFTKDELRVNLPSAFFSLSLHLAIVPKNFALYVQTPDRHYLWEMCSKFSISVPVTLTLRDGWKVAQSIAMIARGVKIVGETKEYASLDEIVAMMKRDGVI